MANKYNIAICSTSFFEYDRRMQRISKALNEDGHLTTWFSRSYDSNTPSTDQNNLIKTFFKKGPFFYLEFNLRLLYLLYKTDCNLIVAVDLDTLIASALACKIKKAKLVFDAHEIFYEVPELHNKPMKKWLWKNIAHWGIPKTNLCYTVNNSLKNHYESTYNVKFHVIRNVPFLNLNFNYKNNFNKKQLVYLGVLNKGRGVETAIKSLKLLPNYKLLLIGGGDITAELNSLAKELQVAHQIEFTGYIDPDQIQELLGESSIGINLLEAYSENYRLSLANKFFDYMHAGLPSINMNFPEYISINSEYPVALLCDNLNTKEFIGLVKKLEKKELYDQIHSNCIKCKKLFNWQHESSKLCELYATQIRMK